MSGTNSNKVFHTDLQSIQPYYYIIAHLNLDGAEVGALPNNYVYFFNVENNFNYLNPALYPDGPDSYPGFYPIDEQSVIGEVVVYSIPDLKYTYNGNTLSDLDFFVGGAYLPSISESVAEPLDVWGGPTGNVPGPIQGNLIQTAQVCRYGREPQNPDPYEKVNQTRKFLALNIRQHLQGNPTTQHNQRNQPKTVLGKIKSIYKSIRSRGKAPKQIRSFLNEDALDSGVLYVVVKIYPKFQ
jgi:hypothetical protein